MDKIIIWIDSSIKIKNKILKLNQSLKKNYDKRLFISKEESTAKTFRRSGLDIISIESNILDQQFYKTFNYDSITPLEINKDIYSEIIKFSFYNQANIPLNLSYKYKDSFTQIQILKSFFEKLIDKYKISHSLILNGISLNSFSLALISSQKNLNILFWENGLYPNSLFINKVGVNAFAKNFYINEYINNDIYKNLKEILTSEFDPPEIKKILITLQVNKDSNIKLFSPFISVNDFLLYLCEEIKSSFYKGSLVKVRNHPKENINLDSFYKNIHNFVRSKSDSINKDINWSDIVFTINSTSGFEAILNNKNLITFGNSFYTKFLRHKNILINGVKYKLYIFNRNLECDKDIKEQLLKNLSNNSLFMNEQDDVWSFKIEKEQLLNNKSYFLNDSFDQFLYKLKISNIKDLNKNYKFILLKFCDKIYKKIQSIIS